ncbi:MAG: 16S rRNA (cytosine(967)-C(5))-methyltransferase RsmB [Defluviitaleaceae bacterium]|nr:16S rRNA (cytosine(967)-C(5))-methyltransferase RsmB [Defluviitaleaceae bacterium]
MKSQKSNRGYAVDILSDILENGAYANIALRRFLGESDLDSRDRAFVTELVNETLRNLLSIDYVINHFSKITVDKMKPYIRNLLRISLCQLRHIEKTPDSAAVNEAVILAKKNGYAGLSGFVNGVLRAVARQPEIPSLDDFYMRYSYPKWLAGSLAKWLGPDETRFFCENSHMVPPVTVFPNTIKTTQAGLVERLQSEGVESTPLGDDFIVLRKSGDITNLQAYQDGLFFVMDPGALWAIKAMDLKSGFTVMDLCAAPGGKSFATACYMGNTGRIMAFDLHPHRTTLINQARKNMGLTCIHPETRDALEYDQNLHSIADVVLLDAPCTGFGTIRKRPEIKYNRNFEDITALAEKQRQLLSVAAKYVKLGGVLVYSTCTVAREENIDNVRWFLQNHPFIMRRQNPPTDMGHLYEEDCLQILPGPTNDGFFIAAMVRNTC